MDLIPTLQLLWRQKLRVLIALVASVAIGVVLIGSSRQHTIGVASANVLVDTPTSSIADLSPAGSDVIAARATLLANMMATTTVRDGIAKLAGIAPDELAVSVPSSAAPLPTAFAVGAGKASTVAPPYELTLATDPTLPIIAISASAPDRAAAQRLAASGEAGLRQYLTAIASAQHIPKSKQPVLSFLGSPVSATAVRGTRKLYGVAAAIIALAFFLAIIVMAPRLAHAWRITAQDAETADAQRAAAKVRADRQRALHNDTPVDPGFDPEAVTQEFLGSSIEAADAPQEGSTGRRLSVRNRQISQSTT